MNILQILPELNVGGVETGTRDLARYIVSRGHKSVIVSHGGILVDEIERQGSIHYTLPVHKKSIFTILYTIPKLVQIIHKEEIDIIHARSRVPAWIAFFAARLSGRVFVTTCHGYYKTHLFSRSMSWGKLVICPSQVIASHMNKDFGLSLERIRLIPRGVDLERFTFLSPKSKRSDVFNIGIIGRLSPLKGHTYFLRAVARVIRRINSPFLKAWIVGDAAASHQEYKRELEVLVKRLGLGYYVEFLGTQKDVSNILSRLNLLVLSSVCHEAFGRVIIEAQAAGVPVIATSVGGVVDIIDDNLTGLLVPPADIEGLSEGIIKMIKDESLRDYLAKNAYQKVKEKFNLELMCERTLEVYREAISSFKILVIKLSSLGDIVLVGPSLRALRRKYPKPNYKISMLVNTPYQELLFNCPYIDELIVCDFNERDRGIKGFFRVAQELRSRNFDFVVDLQNNYRTHLLSALSLIPVRYGYKRKFGFLLSHSLQCGQMIHGPIEHQFKLLEILGIHNRDSKLELWPSQSDEEYIDNFINRQWLGPKQILVGINLSASKRWLTKSWPIEYIADLCESLSLKDIRMVFTGEKEDLFLVNRIIGLLESAKPIVACGKTSINQLVCLIKRCKVFITSDSAPLHIAAAVGTPYVCLFGPTNPRWHVSLGHRGIIIYKNLPCSPCYKSRCKTRKCMYAIKPQEVLRAVKKLL